MYLIWTRRCADRVKFTRGDKCFIAIFTHYEDFRVNLIVIFFVFFQNRLTRSYNTEFLKILFPEYAKSTIDFPLH